MVAARLRRSIPSQRPAACHSPSVAHAAHRCLAAVSTVTVRLRPMRRRRLLREMYRRFSFGACSCGHRSVRAPSTDSRWPGTLGGGTLLANRGTCSVGRRGPGSRPVDPGGANALYMYYLYYCLPIRLFLHTQTFHNGSAFRRTFACRRTIQRRALELRVEKRPATRCHFLLTFAPIIDHVTSTLTLFLFLPLSLFLRWIHLHNI